MLVILVSLNNFDKKTETEQKNQQPNIQGDFFLNKLPPVVKINQKTLFHNPVLDIHWQTSNPALQTVFIFIF